MPLVLSAPHRQPQRNRIHAERTHRKHGHYHQDEQSVSSRERPGFLDLHIAQGRDVQWQTQPIREQMRCQNWVPSHSSESLTGRNAGVRVTQRESRKPISTAITIAANLSVQKHPLIH